MEAEPVKDKEKAEKLAAARKKYEELKKKKPGKKSDKKENSTSSTTATDVAIASSASSSSKTDEVSIEPPKDDARLANPSCAFFPPIKEIEGRGSSVSSGTDAQEETPKSHSTEITTSAQDAINEGETTSSTAPLTPASGRPRGVSSATSFRRASLVAGDSPTVTDVYRKQTSLINDLTAERDKLLDDAAKFKERDKDATQRLLEYDKLKEDLVSMGSEMNELRAKIRLSEQEVTETHEKMESLNSEISTATRLNSHLSTQLAQKDATLTDLRSQNSTSHSATTHDSSNGQEGQIENMSMEISSLRSVLEEQRVLISESVSKIDTLESQNHASIDTIHTLNTKLAEAESQLKKATDRILLETATKVSSETKIAQLERSLDSCSLKGKESDATAQSWQTKFNQASVQYKDAEFKAMESQKKVIALQRENTELLNRLVQLKSRLNELTTENGSLKELADKNRRWTDLTQQDHEIMDDLEDEERKKLESRIQHLEREIQSDQRSPHVDKNQFLDINLDKTQSPTYSSRTGFRTTAGGYTEEDLPAGLNQRIEEIKKELLKWKGFRLDLIPIATGLGRPREIYGEVFEV